jgi:U3 small nucleolar RNA-associated protein 10
MPSQSRRKAVSFPSYFQLSGLASARSPNALTSLQVKEASQIDDETVLGSAQNGLQELIDVEPRLAAFKVCLRCFGAHHVISRVLQSDLFSKKCLQIDRSLLNKRENAALDEKLDKLLLLLSSHVLERRAQKVLEFLLRQYGVHKYNVDALLRCCLPYHESPIFARVVTVARTKKTLWAFAEATRAAQPLSRLAIAKRCAIDGQLLLQICTTAARVDAPRVWITFYALVLVDVLGECAVSASVSAQQQLAHVVLPFAIDSVRSQSESEHRHAGCIVIAQLCVRMRLVNDATLQQIAEGVSSAMTHRDTTRVGVLALAHVCRSQALRTLPTVVVDRLVRDVPRVAALLASMHAEDHVRVDGVWIA